MKRAPPTWRASWVRPRFSSRCGIRSGRSSPPTSRSCAATTTATTIRVGRERSGTEPIDEWLDRHWGGELEPILDYARTVEIFRRHFGAESVRVLLYEDLVRDPAAYVAEVCKLAGIDVEEGVQRTAGRLENSTSERLVETVRRARGRPLGFLRTKIAVALEHKGWWRGDSRPHSDPRPVSPPARRRADARR